MVRRLGAVLSFVVVGLALTGFSGLTAGKEGEQGIPWWVWLLIILVLLAFAAFVYWWWRRQPAEEEPARPARHEPPAAVYASRGEPSQPDDLQIIEGIGPKIAGVLQAAGISTFAQLAATDVDRIKQILEQANPNLLRLADPTTWPEQARLAAEGAWQALEKLQGELKGGRRV